eukprot:scaffold3852_cov402-Prasinococcus_capsulatus_cf.AAC.11
MKEAPKELVTVSTRLLCMIAEVLPHCYCQHNRLYHDKNQQRDTHDQECLFDPIEVVLKFTLPDLLLQDRCLAQISQQPVHYLEVLIDSHHVQARPILNNEVRGILRQEDAFEVLQERAHGLHDGRYQCSALLVR